LFVLRYTDSDYPFGIFTEAVRLRTEERKKTRKQIMASKTLHSIISEIINSVYLKVKEKLEEQTTQWKKNGGTAGSSIFHD
jgi:hypothetical protein